ncbi:hypothetical protein [Lapidilactobacillus wuchangensis]|uniref:hypothetical protein n=1 Tax=Lapidilactobacillus wuchangensis TaxID=2486001 RepID=UPI000F7A5558|nr:hypothetical protein [Lapidilactobacillus wuchangensis]
MGTVNILSKKIRVVHEKRFICKNILLPIILPLVLCEVITNYFPRKKVLSVMQAIFNISESRRLLLESFMFVYPIFIFCIFFFLYRKFISKIFWKRNLLPENQYFLVSVWSLKIATFISGLDQGSATSLPIWQYIDYLYNKESFGWRYLTLKTPDVTQSPKGTEIKQVFYQKNDDKNMSPVRSIIVADTYPIDMDLLPEFVTNHDYVLFQRLVNNQTDRVRGYNQDLVLDIIRQIRKAETDGVQDIYLLLNTSPTHVTEIMRESFQDAGRNSIKHLYVYESQSESPFRFVKPHRIY